MPGLTGEVANLIVALKLDDRGFSGKLNTIGRNLGKLDSGLSQMSRGVGQVGSGLARLGTVAGTAAVGGLAAVITTAASMEQAFTGIQKTVDETATTSFEDLRKTLRGMSVDTGTAFEDLSRIGEIGGALGVGIESLDEFIDVVNRLSVSTDLTVETASTALGQLGNILHLTGDDYRDLADILVALGNAGASTEPQIVDLAARFAAAGNAAGLTKEEILALASAASSMGVEVEAGGTALSMTFNNVATAIGTGGKEIEAFTELLGINAAEFKRRWTEDALGTFQEFIEQLATLDQYEQADILTRAGITGTRQLNAIKLLTQNTGFFADQLAIAEGAAGALGEESDKFFGTSARQFLRLKEGVRLVADTIGTELLPITDELITDFLTFLQLNTTQAGIVQFAKDLAGGVRGLVSELRGTDFSSLIGGMKLAAEVAGRAFDLFKSLPAPVQQLAIAALVANKVSGGAVGQIAKGLGNILVGGVKTGGGLAGLFGGRGASPANPMFVAVTNQLPGGAGAPVVAGGAGAVIRSFLGVTTAVGFGAILGNVIGRELFFNPTVAPAKEFAGRALTGAAARGDVEALEAGLREIDASLQNLRVDILPGGLGQVLFGQEIDELKAMRAIAVEELAKAQALVEAQKAANAKYGEGAAAIAARVESLKLPLGLNNIIAGQIRSLGQQQVEQARLTRANTADSARWQGQANSYLATVAAKEFSPTINLTNVTTVKFGVTALQTQVTRARIASGGSGGFQETI